MDKATKVLGAALIRTIDGGWESDDEAEDDAARIKQILAESGLAIVPVEPKALEAHLNAACADAELAVVPIEPTQKMIMAALPADLYEAPFGEAEEASLTQAEEITRTMWQAMLRAAQERGE